MSKRLALQISAGIGLLLGIMLLIPGLIVHWVPDIEIHQSREPKVSLVVNEQKPIPVPVYLSKTRRVEQIPLEEYVRGVLAAEMPAEFELEALKAQAIAARTYIIRRMVMDDHSQVPDDSAFVTDTVTHQAYLQEQQLKKQWGKEYNKKIEKINQAVNETSGLIITYEGEPIQAAFFSTSNGYTENSEDYWSDAVPYLRSVASPWDVELSPKYKTTVTISYSTFLKKLGLGSKVKDESIQIVNRTEGKRIGTIRISGKTFSGREVREKLGLHSSQFTWKRQGNKIEITTFGYGHGVGMSQYGAEGMAKEGKKAADILQYYYQGIEIKPAAGLLEIL